MEPTAIQRQRADAVLLSAWVVARRINRLTSDEVETIIDRLLDFSPYDEMDSDEIEQRFERDFGTQRRAALIVLQKVLKWNENDPRPPQVLALEYLEQLKERQRAIVQGQDQRRREQERLRLTDNAQGLPSCTRLENPFFDPATFYTLQVKDEPRTLAETRVLAERNLIQVHVSLYESLVLLGDTTIELMHGPTNRRVFVRVGGFFTQPQNVHMLQITPYIARLLDNHTTNIIARVCTNISEAVSVLFRFYGTQEEMEPLYNTFKEFAHNTLNDLPAISLGQVFTSPNGYRLRVQRIYNVENELVYMASFSKFGADVGIEIEPETPDNIGCVLCGENVQGVCGGCGIVAYCGGECQTKHWDQEHGQECRALIGLKSDLPRELEHRKEINPNNYPFEVLVGPNTLYRHEYKGTQIVLLGETHNFSATNNMYRGMLEIQVGRNKDVPMRFVGNEFRYMGVARFLYALAAASEREQRQTDVFLEVKYDAGAFRRRFPQRVDELPKMRSYEGNLILRSAKMFRNMGCTTLVRERQPECDVFPYTRVHYADYRPTTTLLGFTLDNIVFKGMTSLMQMDASMAQQSLLSDFRDTVQQWIDQDIPSIYRDLYMNSSDFANDWRDVFYPLYVDLYQKIAATILSSRFRPQDAFHLYEFTSELENLVNVKKMRDMLKSGGTQTVLAKQLSALDREDPEMANTIRMYFQTKYETSVLPDLVSLMTSLVYGNAPQASDAGARINAWIMDATLLARLFRTYGQEPSRVRVVYTGAAHTEIYEHFFDTMIYKHYNTPFQLSVTELLGRGYAVTLKPKDQAILNQLIQ